MVLDYLEDVDILELGELGDGLGGEDDARERDVVEVLVEDQLAVDEVDWGDVLGGHLLELLYLI